MAADSATPAATYVAAAIPPDSINHFVVLMTASQWQPVIATAIALTRVIENIPRQETETQIVQLKLSWWLEEIEMIARDKPRHPLSIELARLVEHRRWLDPLHAVAGGALDAVAQPPMTALADLLPHCHRASERQALMAAVLPQCDDRALTQARSAGVGICLTELLARRHEHGSLIPPQGFDGLTAAATNEKLAKLADDHFQTDGSMPAGQRQAQRSVMLQARLYQRLLRRLRQNDFDPHKAAMRPLGLLWHAWREARNLLK